MNNEDDIFFEEDEEDEDDTFPDEDIADEDIAEEDDEEFAEDFDISPYEEKTGSWLQNYLMDPWAKTVFVITVIGLLMVLLTPESIWAPNRYGIIGVFFLIVAALVGIAFSLITWNKAGTHRLKWAGPVNIIVILAATVIGIIDTASWIFTGASMIPALDSPLILLCFMLVFFSLYMLWMIQRSLDPEAR
jgi:hypothetical protein